MKMEGKNRAILFGPQAKQSRSAPALVESFALSVMSFVLCQEVEPFVFFFCFFCFVPDTM